MNSSQVLARFLRWDIQFTVRLTGPRRRLQQSKDSQARSVNEWLPERRLASDDGALALGGNTAQALDDRGSNSMVNQKTDNVGFETIGQENNDDVLLTGLSGAIGVSNLKVEGNETSQPGGLNVMCACTLGLNGGLRLYQTEFTYGHDAKNTTGIKDPTVFLL